jgi:hypothetical protein
MPIVESLMRELQAKYGAEKGKRIYYAMEAEGKGPFARGAKHRDKHEAFVAKHNLGESVGPAKKVKTKKARPPAKRGGPPKRR